MFAYTNTHCVNDDHFAGLQRMNRNYTVLTLKRALITVEYPVYLIQWGNPLYNPHMIPNDSSTVSYPTVHDAVSLLLQQHATTCVCDSTKEMIEAFFDCESQWPHSGDYGVDTVVHDPGNKHTDRC
jgi:hypothetical protein